MVFDSVGAFEFDGEPARAAVVDAVDHHDRVGQYDPLNCVCGPSSHFGSRSDLMIALREIACWDGKQADAITYAKFGALGHERE